jgi:integrase
MTNTPTQGMKHGFPEVVTGEGQGLMSEVVRQGGVESAGTPRPSKKMTVKARGLGRIYQRGEIWWVQYSWRGTLHRESSKSTARARAVALLRKRHAEMGRGRLVGPDFERVSFEDLAAMLVQDYQVNERKSLDRCKRSIAHLRNSFGTSMAPDITPDRVDAYICARLAAGTKPATVRLDLAALGRMFTLGERAGKVPHRPRFASIEVRNTRSGFFEDADLREVLEQLPKHLCPVVQFAHLTGWRKGEVLGLQWRQVDFKAGVVRLEPGSTKNDEGRSFPFAALPALEALLGAQRGRTAALERERGQVIPWVFHRFGKPIRSFHSAWQAACERAEVPGRLFHDLRRTAVRNLERAGVPRSWAMKLTGHKTESVYRRYAIVSEADLTEGVRRLAALSSQRESPRIVNISSSVSSRTSTEEAQSEEDRG